MKLIWLVSKNNEVEGILCNFTCVTKVTRKKVTFLPLSRECTTIGSKKWYNML
jgi:hypothetical protein